jgi:hypothetical protein
MDFVLRDKMDKLLMSNIVFPWHFQNALKKEGKKKFLDHEAIFFVKRN